MERFKINIRPRCPSPIANCLLPIAYCLLPIACFPQSPSILTTADKNAILIGEQVKVTIKANFRSGLYNVHWLSLPDSIPHFEIVDPGKPDSITYKDNSKAIEQTIIFTSFDSGKWVIPSFRINFDPLVDDTTLNLFTDSISVNVMYSPPDSTNQLRDIKPIQDVNITDYTWYYIAGGALLLCVAAFFIWRYIKKRKPRPAPVFASKLSPYDEAMEELKKLGQYDLQHAAEVKIVHSRLSEIFKRYLGRKENKNLATNTTGELLIHVGENNLSKENISTLATALRCGDAVKFAKYLPTMIESDDCKQKIKETINLIEPLTSNP
jgi:hypothetical protein